MRFVHNGELEGLAQSLHKFMVLVVEKHNQKMEQFVRSRQRRLPSRSAAPYCVEPSFSRHGVRLAV